MFAASPALRAQGSPPMNTDDPGTPGNGSWEINLGVAQARAAGARATAGPIVDVAYGVTDNLEFGYAVAWLQATGGGQSESGLSNSTAGLKWRFHGGDQAAMAASLAPKVEFNNPGSNSRRKGLVDPDASVTLPFQAEFRLGGGVTLNLEAGRVFHFRHADEWLFGAALGREFGDVTLGIELYGDAAKNFERSGLLLNAGAAIEVHKNHSLFLAVGRELHRHDGPRARFAGYLGWQIRR